MAGLCTYQRGCEADQTWDSCPHWPYFSDINDYTEPRTRTRTKQICVTELSGNVPKQYNIQIHEKETHQYKNKKNYTVIFVAYQYQKHQKNEKLNYCETIL